KRVASPGRADSTPQLPSGFEQPEKERLITSISVIETLALIAVSLLTGTVLNELLKGTAFELPNFVCVLFVGVLLRNGLSAFG
ncbi:sodium/glutamate symporter, partial [Escherichia coli]|nr:sodium/glutamate symporter [Escherichia coli]